MAEPTVPPTPPPDGVPAVDVRDVAVVDEPAFVRQLHATLLTEAFSAEELVDVDDLLDVSDGPPSISVAMLDGRPVGVAVCHREPDQPVELLTYLAVDPSIRGHGIGGALLDHLARRWSATADLALVVGEVHDPRFHPATPDERPVDRLAFYARHGAGLLDLPWVQPAVGADTRPVEGMLLLVLHPRDPAPGTTVPASMVSAWVEYQYDPPTAADRPHLAALRGRLAAGDRIAIRPLRPDAVDVTPLVGAAPLAPPRHGDR